MPEFRFAVVGANKTLVRSYTEPTYREALARALEDGKDAESVRPLSRFMSGVTLTTADIEPDEMDALRRV